MKRATEAAMADMELAEEEDDGEGLGGGDDADDF
jgi:hypothetical protein